MIGLLLTFIQFLYVALQTLPTQLTWQPKQQHETTGKPTTAAAARSWLPRLKPRAVPLRRWIVQVALFLAVSLMNNAAFGFRVPVPIHIIFRSGGEFEIGAGLLLRAFRKVTPPRPVAQADFDRSRHLLTDRPLCIDGNGIRSREKTIQPGTSSEHHHHHAIQSHPPLPPPKADNAFPFLVYQQRARVFTLPVRSYQSS